MKIISSLKKVEKKNKPTRQIKRKTTMEKKKKTMRLEKMKKKSLHLSAQLSTPLQHKKKEKVLRETEPVETSRDLCGCETMRWVCS